MSDFTSEIARRLGRLERAERRRREPGNTVSPQRPHPQVWDDFVGGNEASGTIGERGWTHVGGTLTPLGPNAGHLGIKRLNSSGVAGTLAVLALGASTTNGAIRPVDFWTVRFVVRLGTTVDANTMIRVGIGLSAQANPPNNGAYVEKLLADTTFYAVSRAATVETRSQILTTAGAAMSALTASRWYRIRVRRVSSTAFGFTVEEPETGASYPEVTISTNTGLSTSGMTMFFQVHNGAAAANRHLDVDWAELQLANLVR